VDSAVVAEAAEVAVAVAVAVIVGPMSNRGSNP